MTPSALDLEIGQHVMYLWITPTDHVLPIDAKVVGFTPQRVRILVFDHNGEPARKTVQRENLRLPKPHEQDRSRMTGIGLNEHIELEDWMAQNARLTWDRLVES